MNEILDGSDVGDRSGDRKDAVGKKGILLAPLGDCNVSIDRTLVVNGIQPFPLRPDGGLVDLLRERRKKKKEKEQGADYGKNPECIPNLRGGCIFWPEEKYRNEGIQGGNQKSYFK